MIEDKFETIQIGDEAEITHTISAGDVDRFADLTGDDNPLHVDEAYAATTTFKHRVVHGMLTASFISTMIGTKLPGKGSLWYEQQTRFLLPVRIGERIRVHAVVLKKSLSQRIIVLSTAVYGDDGRKVIEGEAKVKVLEPVKKEQPAPAVMSHTQKDAVIVSGSGRGIGAAIARALAADGYAVVINYLKDSASAEALAGEIIDTGGRATTIQADIADTHAVKELVAQTTERLGTICGIVNNASGLVDARDFMDMTWDEVQKHIDIQLKGAFNLTQAVMPLFMEQKSGLVVTISSIYADSVPPPKLLHYSTVKAALNAFTKSIAVDYGPRGIRANTVSVGMTETDLIAGLPEKVKMVTKMQTPLRRLATPADVASAVSFLYSEKAAFISGHNLRVCGGMVME